MQLMAKARMEVCYEKNLSGDPAYKDLTAIMKAQLRGEVSYHIHNMIY